MAIKIYIDQGHNPQNPNAGAEGNGFREQDLTFEVGLLLADFLNANPNFEARVSRPTPETGLGTSNVTSLRARVDDANSWGADYFISLHMNAAESPLANGAEAFVYSQDSPAYALAGDILRWIGYDTGISSRGVFLRPSLYVLRKTLMPALLLEMGFITNASDANFVATYPEMMAEAIYNGILNYFGTL